MRNTYITKDKQHEYRIEKRKRAGGYQVYVLGHYDNPNKYGEWQRVRSIAEFGNTKHPDSLKNARFCMVAFGQVLDLE